MIWLDQKDPIWTCVSRLKECAFVLSSSALDYGKRPFTINSFCAVQYRLSRKKKKRKKFCKPSMQLTEESVALPKFPFVFFRLLGTQTLWPNLYATLLYIQIFSLHPLSRGKYDEFFAQNRICCMGNSLFIDHEIMNNFSKTNPGKKSNTYLCI